MLKLVNILNIDESEYINYKIHFATGTPDQFAPLKLFYINEFEKDQMYQSNKNFQRKYVISLIYLDINLWLFAGVYEVISQPAPMKINNWNYFLYDLKLVNLQNDLIGRAVVYYEKKYRYSYPNLEMIPKNGNGPRDIEIVEIRRNKVTIEDFPGYDKVNISYLELKKIIDNNIITWKNSLSKAKGIYLIMDINTGRQYVGSAYGQFAIWQRFSEYVKTGHGGNKMLKDILKMNGPEYKISFKFSILEICNLNTSDIYIFERENYWKELLMTRKFGLNAN